MVDTEIPGVVFRNLTRNSDSRGWLVELFRKDEIPDGFEPEMAYLSVTHPGVSRGPHEHKFQTDGFAFVDGTYELFLWENRPEMPSCFLKIVVGEENPVAVFVPPGVVHAYKNVGDRPAYVINFPNKLYGGWGKSEPVDEIRHETNDNSPYQLI